jgi:hypothetical protein
MCPCPWISTPTSSAPQPPFWASDVTLTFTLLAGAVVAALLGATIRTPTQRSSSGQTDRWQRLHPYLYVASGFVMFVSGWFLRDASPGAASINVLAGATLFGAGAGRIARRHRRKEH